MSFKESVYKKDGAYNKAENNIGYDSLANAIVLQALNDYKVAKMRLNNNDFTTEFSKLGCERFIREVPKFLNSQYFSVLTNLDGAYLLQIADRTLAKEYGVE